MIETRRPRVPWLGVVLVAIPWFALRMGNYASHTLLPLTMRKFTNDAALIAFIASTDTLIGMILGPLVAWKSDRIWTRIGRRKPFILLATLGSALVLPILPFTGSMLMLAIVISIYNVCSDANIYEPLYMEVVPPPQRGRAASIRQAMLTLSGLFMSLVLFANWRSSSDVLIGGRKFTISGEMIAYFTISLALVGAAALVLFSVKEVRPEKQPANEPFSFKSVFGSVFLDKQLLKIYTLFFASMAMSLGLASFQGLMMTEQFQYSFKATGKMWSGLQLIQFFLILPLAGFIADRVDRLKLFLIGISISTCFPICFWTYIHFFCPNNIPSMQAIMFFQGADHLVDFTATIAVMPLAYDYMPRARMGTLFAGMALVKGMLRLLLTNAMGLFIKFYSQVFCPKGVNDYTSGYLFIFLMGVLGIVSALYFIRERAAGRIIPYGKIEHEEAQKAGPPAANDQQHAIAVKTE